MILHAKDSITRLNLEHGHRICIYQRTEAVKEFVQQRYVVIGVRKTLWSIRFRCFLCRCFDAQNIQPLMAPLPVCRFPDTLSQFPFANTGADFFGPLYIEDTKDKLTKYYSLIFTCMVTRAAHLESCPVLNRDTFLNALRRFASRRCQPKLILSDNGKTFIEANEELKRCVCSLDNQRIASELLIKNTVWKFNPPYGPHFGGAWERLIQNTKRIILIILGSKRLTSDIFHTTMVETESVLKSRPLTHVADVPDNEEPINPNYFLVQRPYNSMPPGGFSSTRRSNRYWS